MKKKMEIMIKITDENGEILASQTSEREVPYIEELVEQGFRGAFHELEVAVLESRKEVSEGIISEYLGVMSEKKPEMKQELGKLRREDIK